MPHSSKTTKHHSKTSFRTFVGFHASSLGSQRKATWSRPPAKTAGSSALLSQPQLCDRVMSLPIEFTNEGWMITKVPLWLYENSWMHVSWLYHTYKMCFLLSTSRLWDLYVYKTTLVNSIYAPHKIEFRSSADKIWDLGLRTCWQQGWPGVLQRICHTLQLQPRGFSRELLGTLKARMPSPWHCRTLLEAPYSDMPVLQTQTHFSRTMIFMFLW